MAEWSKAVDLSHLNLFPTDVCRLGSSTLNSCPARVMNGWLTCDSSDPSGCIDLVLSIFGFLFSCFAQVFWCGVGGDGPQAPSRICCARYGDDPHVLIKQALYSTYSMLEGENSPHTRMREGKAGQQNHHLHYSRHPIRHWELRPIFCQGLLLCYLASLPSRRPKSNFSAVILSLMQSTWIA